MTNTRKDQLSRIILKRPSVEYRGKTCLEPNLYELLQRYYNIHFGEEEATELIQKYLNGLELGLIRE